MVRRVFILEQKVGNDKEYIMTVGKLIDKLREYNRGTEIMIDVYDGWNNPSCDIVSVYMDCLYDTDYNSTRDKCVYLEIAI